MAGAHVRFEVSPENFLAHLTDAAFEVALKHGLKVPFIEIELDLHEALRRIIEVDLLVSEACGSPECLALKKESLGPWTPAAKKLFKEE